MNMNIDVNVDADMDVGTDEDVDMDVNMDDDFYITSFYEITKTFNTAELAAGLSVEKLKALQNC
jgi:hypothetical protein